MTGCSFTSAIPAFERTFITVIDYQYFCHLLFPSRLLSWLKVIGTSKTTCAPVRKWSCQSFPRTSEYEITATIFTHLVIDHFPILAIPTPFLFAFQWVSRSILVWGIFLNKILWESVGNDNSHLPMHRHILCRLFHIR